MALDAETGLLMPRRYADAIVRAVLRQLLPLLHAHANVAAAGAAPAAEVREPSWS